MIKHTLFNKCLFTFLLGIISGIVCAQRIAPSPYNSNAPINYIRAWDVIKPETNPNNITIGNTLQQSRMTTQYFDGLGRPLQTVIKQGSLTTGYNAVDLINPVVYDEFGREKYKYLPFAANNTGGNASISDGFFKLNPFQQDSAFNKNQFSDESWYYSQITFESSPLNRVIENFSPGNNWVGSIENSENNRHSIKTKYWVNTATDSVRIWNVTDVANGFGTYSTNSMYAAATLYKNITVDENNNQVVEFKDLEGRVILRKVQLTASPDTGTGKGYSGWLCTYYIYDDLGQLRCVVQPKGVELLLTNSWSFSSDILNEQSFPYEYDGRQRLILKKVPGAGIVYMIYDARDRLVMTQDSLQRAAHKWVYTLYDGLNRPTTTGLITDNTNYNNAAYHRSQAETSIAYPNVGSYTNEELTKTFYDDYTWLAANGNPFSENRITGHDGNFLTPSNIIYPYPQPLTQSFSTKGLATGGKVKVMGSNQYLCNISYYDDKGRVIQTLANNITGWSNTVQTQYDFSGKALKQISVDEKYEPYQRKNYVVSSFEYDDLGRLLSLKKYPYSYVNNNTWIIGTENEIVRNEYNALGQLTKKKLAPNNNTGLETQNFDYNIRGWLLGANRNYVKTTTSTTNWFGFDLGYDKTSFTVNGSSKSYANAQYGGNISGMLWRGTGDDELRKYDFIYDALNRLTSADFNQFSNNNFSKSVGIDFSVTGLNYDANGNILNMNQKGWKLGGSVTIDSLLYTYVSNSNKLLNVIDRMNDTTTKLGDFRSSHSYMVALSNNKTTLATDYMYDVNGNLTLDNNKDISYIHYNHLNLPDSIVVANKGNIKYIYDAAGNKLKKITTEGSNVTTILYIGGAEYKNDSLQFISHEEGRIRFKASNSSFQFDYFLKDHLGNARMVLTEEQQTDAYPVASLETNSLPNERFYYSKVDSGRVNKNTVSGYPNDTTYTNPNDYIQKLNGNGVKIGTGVILKVMAGDQFNVRVNSWYKTNGAAPNSPNEATTDIVSALNSGIAAKSGGKATLNELQNGNLFPDIVGWFLNQQKANSSGSKPRAYVTWIAFDEQFKYEYQSSGFEQVGDNEEFKTHLWNNLAITKSGYLYIYVSNETPNIDVFFDNLQVTHIRGHLIEETHYYPFGLTMSGITSKAVNFGSPENKKNKFQNQEYNDDLGVDMYEFKYRMDDPQIGRFWQIDPISNKYVYNSIYAFSENKVTGHIELEGLEAVKPQVSNPTKTEKKDKPGFSFTVALTLGSSVAAEVGVENTPIHGQIQASAGEVDVIGFRDSKFVFMGKTKDGTHTERRYAGLELLGFGKSETTEIKTTKNEEYSETITQTTGGPGAKEEKTMDAMGNEIGQRTTYLKLEYKSSLFLGVELNAQIPMRGYYATPIPPKNGFYKDATNVKENVLPAALLKIK